MTRAEYLVELETHLARQMPPQRLEYILAYYREYFDEAGPGREGQVMEELGTPERLARRILGDETLEALARPVTTPPGGQGAPRRPRRGLHALWTVLLAVCAAPIAIPLIIVAVALVIAVVVAVAAVVIGVAAAGVACVAAGLFVSWCGFAALFSAGLTTTMYFVGLGLLASGVGILIIVGVCALAGLCFRGVARLLGRLLHRKEARA